MATAKSYQVSYYFSELILLSNNLLATKIFLLLYKHQVQHTPKFLKTYNQRAGVEGTISQGVRRSAWRQSRYIGLAKTHLQYILIAVGLNLCRLNDWLDDIPIAATRYSRFMAFKPKVSSI